MLDAMKKASLKSVHAKLTARILILVAAQAVHLVQANQAAILQAPHLDLQVPNLDLQVPHLDLQAPHLAPQAHHLDLRVLQAQDHQVIKTQLLHIHQRKLQKPPLLKLQRRL